MSNEGKYSIRFEYADGQQYDSGAVYMTIEQAAKMEEFLSSLEANEQISEPFCGEYRDWENPLAQVISDLVTEFHPATMEGNVKKAWDALESAAKAVQS